MTVKRYNTPRARRHAQIRGKVSGTSHRPRLSVFRSNREIYAQLIDDAVGKTMVAANSSRIQVKPGVRPVEKAHLVGGELAKRAQKVGIKQVVFDRGGYLFHGRVKALAEGAREGGLKF